MMNPVKADSSWLRSELIASWREIAAVLFVIIGEPIYVSAQGALHGSSSYYTNLFLSNSWLLHNMVWQSTMLALTLGFLHWRRWTPADFKIRLGWWSSLQGVLLSIALKVGYTIALFIIVLIAFFFQDYARSHGFFGANGSHAHIHSEGPNWALRIVSNVINAYWEELTCM